MVQKKTAAQFISTLFWNAAIWMLVVVTCQRSIIPISDPIERVRQFTRSIEFDYTTWTWDAIQIKAKQSLINLPAYLPTASKHDLVIQYAELVQQKQAVTDQIFAIYANPDVTNPAEAAKIPEANLSKINKTLSNLGPVVETIIQHQVSTIIADEGLSIAGYTFPNVLYHATPLPLALIVSPREVIQQDANISLLSDLSMAEITALEEQAAQSLNVSTLVEEVGGIGTYPTMVQQTSDINWLIEVVAHEWIHNYLTLYPLGLNYDTSPELRTMNETTANLAGKELSAKVIARYYPELVPPPPAPEPSGDSTSTPPPGYDFRAEMHQTRVTVDALLQQGKIDEAEQYMEARRQDLWDHGYQIRKLNQAYFAFHGAYADVPGGAAGKDPVGPAVRQLREKSNSLRTFLTQISRLTSFEQLNKLIAE